MSATRIVPMLLIVGMLAIPALAWSQDESQLWSGKVGILVPTASGTHAGIALGIERQLSNGTGSRSAIELDYAHPSGVSDWYLLYNARYHVQSGGYWGWGAGLSTMESRGSTDTNLAYRLFYGQNWSRTFGEIGWISGMKDGNSGILLTVGAKF
jgi:hypothetical protein